MIGVLQPPIFVDGTAIGNDDNDTASTIERALSSQDKRSNEPCVHCGIPVSVPIDQETKVYCVDCRPKPSSKGSGSDASPLASPVKLSADDIMTVTCQLCRSSLLVNQSKIGTKVTCPDCHSEVVVQRPKKKVKRKTGRPQPEAKQTFFDPNAELSLEDPVERPIVHRPPDLDDDTEDLLSAPLPEPDPLSAPPDESIDADDVDDPLDDEKLSRRERYERIQHQAISEGRKKMRAQARAKRAGKKLDSEAAKGSADTDGANSSRRRRRRRKGRRGERGSQWPSWVKPAFGWLRYRSMIIGWVLSAACMSGMYFAGADWSPLDLLDRTYGMLTREPLVWDVWLMAKSILLAVGSLWLYFLCGRSFAMNAEVDREAEGEPDSSSRQPESSRFFTTMHFSIAWWLAGLPFLYFSTLLLPAQFLIVPPLLVGSWLNRSIWKFVHADGLGHADSQKEGRRLWRNFYGVQFVAAAIAIMPALMIRTGGVPSVVGCFLVGGIMIGMAGICGRHCRELSNSVEPSP